MIHTYCPFLLTVQIFSTFCKCFTNAIILIGPNSGIVLFEVVYINKWSTPQEAASWLHEPASMYEVIPSKPISTEEFTAKQLQWGCMKAIQAVRYSWVLIFLESGPGETESVGLALDLYKELDSSHRQDLEGEPGVGSCQDSETMRVLTIQG